MGNRGVAGNDQIKAHHHSSGVEEGMRTSVKAGPQRLNPADIFCGQVAIVLLQTDQAHAIPFAERC